MGALLDQGGGPSNPTSIHDVPLSSRLISATRGSSPPLRGCYRAHFYGIFVDMNNLIGIVSDTHEDVRMIVKAVALFKSRSPALVIHCGDIISPPVLERFAGLPLKLVFGNNDGERSGLKKKCAELGFTEIQDTLTFEFAEKSFFVNHGTSAKVIDDAVATQRYDYVLHGHTHEPRDEVVGRTRIVNPGALFSAETLTVAFLEPKTGAVEFVTIPN